MKRLILLCTVLSLLSGCGSPAAENRILVCIEEVEGCTVENNGQLALPSEDVTFTLQLDYGYALSSVEYAGEYLTDTQRRTVSLTLKNVAYPTRAKLHLTSKYCGITYDANDGVPLQGTETAVTRNYDLTNHRRPNTEQGTHLFAREGYTLLCWNTKADGSGERIGLGSRVTAEGHSMTLYAQWMPWSDAADFSYEEDGTVTIIAYHGTDDPVVVPAQIGGKPVTRIAVGAFTGCAAENLIFPNSLTSIADGAFQDCAVRSLTLFDNLEEFSDHCFLGCDSLQTLYINAVEAPYGCLYRKESCYADKVDLLILAQGKAKLVFYGGCSTWYNLDGLQVAEVLDGNYSVINMGLNGTIDSTVQMQIMGAYLESGDILFHTPELSSRQQLMIIQDMTENGDILWCGLEGNYDLFSLADLRRVNGALDSLCSYLGKKDRRGSYLQYYTDDQEQAYMDSLGCIPFYRSTTAKDLADNVTLNPKLIDQESLERLRDYYDWYESLGIKVYVSYACVNMDAVPENQRGNVQMMDGLFHEAINSMGGPVLVSKLEDYLYHTEDFYDTNYHLRSEPAKENTTRWLEDLLSQMEADGLWEAAS